MTPGDRDRRWRRLPSLIPLAGPLRLAISRPLPELPSELAERRAERTIVVRVDIARDRAGSAEITGSSGGQQIDQAFADIILKECRFRPAYKNLGTFPIASTIELRLTLCVS